MRTRRSVITLLGGAVTWPLAAHAQQPERVRRIAVLMSLAVDDAESSRRLTAFVQALQQLGWTDSRNVRIEYRWGAGDPEQIRRYAAELATLAPEVILSVATATLGPLLQATRAVPIVFVNVGDPVGAGFVESLARPGGNATGFALFEYGVAGKWLELLREIAPRVMRAAVIRDAALASGIGYWGALQSAAPVEGGVDSHRSTRCRRDRTRAGRFRGPPEQRPDCDGQYVGDRPSRSDRHVSGPA
jgi:putative ABC transport system substrate-binding protein